MSTPDRTYLLRKRQHLTTTLIESPYDLILYLERAVAHSSLGYPDLAAGDAYRALLLADEVRDEGFEYHALAKDALSWHAESGLTPEVLLPAGCVEGPLDDDDDQYGDGGGGGGGVLPLSALLRLASVRAFQLLASSLLRIGCLRSAAEFCDRGLALVPENGGLKATKAAVYQAARERLGLAAESSNDLMDPQSLPDRGLVRREVYPWNEYEPDRFSEEAIGFLNGQLDKVAPKVEVRVSRLPVLVGDEEGGDDAPGAGDGEGEEKEVAMCNQLGLFAKEDIAPGEVVLDEYSVLTANNRHKESACDACGEEIPGLHSAEDGGDGKQPVPCSECDDTVFCSEACLEAALEQYHPAVCDKDIDSIAKDPEAKDIDQSLYLLLLARVLAMAEHQGIHPLEVKEVKYIWGDFLPSPASHPTLPFSFTYNISLPLHLLERMDINIYTHLPSSDLWILNTLYAKFRGTASARKNPRDGRPDLAAVHPLWCLANHDCDPNVTWLWEGGRMVLRARETRVVSGEKGGLKKGEEVLNHYCDVELPVRLRREWARGSLGGWCMCGRCRREAKEEVKGEGR
ncbi:hypothetical protein VTJ04DRAFT_478 [Mycothermus thermophilus]|uniref:uncharacterized protein n=1 Tax=Humicola insolens TaxID=85995 RepID=UPI0037427DB2